MTKSCKSKRPKPDAAAGLATATPHSALYVRGEADDSGVIIVCHWFEAADLVSAAKACRLKLLPDADVENVVARLNTEALIATSLSAERRPPRDHRKRKLGAIARSAENTLRLLGLPGDVSPSQALSIGLPQAIAAALRPGPFGVEMPISNELISLAGAAHKLVNAADRAK